MKNRCCLHSPTPTWGTNHPPGRTNYIFCGLWMSRLFQLSFRLTSRIGACAPLTGGENKAHHPM